MTYPTKPADHYDYVAYQAGEPTLPLPAPQVAADFDHLKESIDNTIDFIKDTVRSDNKIAPLMVPASALAQDARALIAAGGNIRGAWTTATAYAVSDVVSEGDSTYIAAIAHTSGVFATDYAADKWLVLSTPAVAGATSAATVANLAALKALVTRPDSVIVKTGRAAGSWQWEAGSSTAADDGLVVQCTSGDAGRYKRIYDGPISITWFGASPTATATANKTALQDLVNAVGAADLAVVAPPGRFLMTGTVTVASALSFAFNGAGAGATSFVWTGAGGFDVDFPTPSSTVTDNQIATIRDVSLLAAVADCGIAIDIAWATAVGDTSPGAIIEGCYIGSENKNLVLHWNEGIKLSNGRNPVVQNTILDGASGTSDFDIAIHLVGGCVETALDNLRVFNCARAVKVEDQCEGVYLTGAAFVGVDIGVDWQRSDGLKGTLMTFIGGHMSVRSRAFILKDVSHGFVSKSLIQKEGGSNYQDFEVVSGCDIWWVYKAHFRGAGTGGTENGVMIAAGAGNGNWFIDNCSFEDRAIAISLGVQNCRASFNKAVGNVTTLVDDAAGGNVVFGNSTGSDLNTATNGALLMRNAALSAGVMLDFSTDAVLKLRNRANSAYAALEALTGTFATGANTSILLHTLSNDTTYNVVSVNGARASTTMMGLAGGKTGDANVNWMAPSGGAHSMRVANVEYAKVDATGVVLPSGARITLANSQSTVGSAGGASALPATPSGYIPIKIGSTEFVLPYYAKS